MNSSDHRRHDCPHESELRMLASSQLQGPARDHMNRHVQECELCAAFLETIGHPSETTTGTPAPSGKNSGGTSLFSPTPDTTVVSREQTVITVKPGDILGSFTIEALIGEGGMGSVYRAIDNTLGRKVAIKLMKHSFSKTDLAATRFHREGQIVASIEHPNIIPLYHFGWHGNAPYLVMPLLRGETLRSRLIRTKRLEFSAALGIAKQVASGLARAHKLGLVHRDIKPDNIWLTEDEDAVKILDFGLAGIASSEANLTAPGALIGTPRYMSPEQTTGIAIDQRADLFSLGAVFYEMLIGRAPFAQQGSIPAVLHAIANLPHTPARTLDPTLPESISQLIDRLLEKAPANRPGSADEVVKLIETSENSSETFIQPRSKPKRPYTVPLAIAFSSLPFAFLLWFSFLTIQTETGEVQISFDPATNPVPVKVNENRTITIEDPTDKQPVEISVDKSTNQLRISKNGFVVVTKSFQLGDDEKRRISVKFVPKTELLTNEKVATEKKSSNLPQAKIESWDNLEHSPPALQIPFSADEAKASQRAWSQYLDIPIRWSNSAGISFVLVPPGEFMMGMTPSDARNVIAHGPEDKHWIGMCEGSSPPTFTRLSLPFYISECEVTQQQYASVVGQNPSYFSPTGNGAEEVANFASENAPVEQVAFYDAIDFCNSLSETESLSPYFSRQFGHVQENQGFGYRLPKDAEWEWACRAGTSEPRYYDHSGDAANLNAWTNQNTRLPRAVGQLSSNAFGVYDMLGNVAEWCSEKFVPFGDDKPLSTHYRITRGFHVFDNPDRIMVGLRPYGATDFRWCQMGIRLAISIPTSHPTANLSQGQTNLEKVTAPDVFAASQANVAELTSNLTIPFDKNTASDAQKQTAEARSLPTTWTNSHGIVFRLVPAGSFAMGISEMEFEELKTWLGDNIRRIDMLKTSVPTVPVKISTPFYLSIHEITQEQYMAVMKENPSYYAADSPRAPTRGHLLADRPVENATFLEVVEFCNRLSAEEKVECRYEVAQGKVSTASRLGYRLPTEAEWEWACRAGTDTPRHFTSEDSLYPGYFAWCDGTTAHPRPVCQLEPNPFGFFDMYGNVSEWVEDWHSESPPFAQEPLVDPVGAARGTHRRIKGNSFSSQIELCRSGYHGCAAMDYRYKEVGFRIAISLPQDSANPAEP